MKNKLGFVLLAVVLMASLVSGCAKGPDTAQVPSEKASAETATQGSGKDQAAPKQGEEAYKDALPVDLKDLSGNAVTLEDYKGQYVILNFWATWCKYCVKEMPDLVQLQKDEPKVKILAVDVNEDQKSVSDFLKKNKLESLTVLMDSEGKVAEAYGVDSFPTSFFIDRSGKVIGYVQGMMEAKDMKNAVQYLKEHDTYKEK